MNSVSTIILQQSACVLSKRKGKPNWPLWLHRACFLAVMSHRFIAKPLQINNQCSPSQQKQPRFGDSCSLISVKKDFIRFLNNVADVGCVCNVKKVKAFNSRLWQFKRSLLVDREFKGRICSYYSRNPFCLFIGKLRTKMLQGSNVVY